MKAWRWGVGLALAALAVVGVSALSRPRGAEVQVATVKRGDLVVPVQCDGTLEPPPGGELRSADAAVVAEIFVAEGARVSPGQELLRLENPDLSRQALDARSEALRLRDEQRAASADFADEEREVEHLREVVSANGRLLSSGAITKAAAQADARALSQAEGRLEAARSRLTGLSGDGSRLSLAEQSAADLERRAAGLTFHAASSGVVYGLPRRTGEAIAAGQVVASVVDPQKRRVRARVDQPDLPRVAAGQRILLAFDGLPGERWEGTVSSVAPGLREVGGREVGEVMGEVADPDGKLPTNAGVDVQIVTGEKSGALVVPRASVIRDGEKRYVYVLESGRAHRREVEVGLSGLNEVEIKAGVADKDTVILPGSTTLSDGLRVRANRGAPPA
jgi:membrane fusion protein (multidrug efflux system)